MNTNIYVQLPLLLIIISLVYASTRHDDWGKILSEAMHWCVRIVIFLLSIGLVLYLIST